MKKSIFITLLAAAICRPCFSGEATAEKNMTNQQNTVEQLFNTFSKEEGATHVKMGGFVMTLARVFADTKGVSDIEVYAFNECSRQVRDNLNAAIKGLKDNSYETLVSTTQEGENTKILVKIKDDYISEIAVIAGGDDPALIRIRGKIKPEDVQGVVDSNKK